MVRSSVPSNVAKVSAPDGRPKSGRVWKAKQTIRSSSCVRKGMNDVHVIGEVDTIIFPYRSFRHCCTSREKCTRETSTKREKNESKRIRARTERRNEE